jgi:hypothetical protein
LKKNEQIVTIGQEIELPDNIDPGNVSDGYHTFNELYCFRVLYNALLFNSWYKQGRYPVHKSRRHSDGNPCFDGNWFVVMALLPTGQISNHYEMHYWDLFKIPAMHRAVYDYDGHSNEDCLKRMLGLIDLE